MAKELKLSHIDNLELALKSNSSLIQVLLGPRQVGKTTSILKMIEDSFKGRAHYISSDGVFHSDSDWLREQWMTAQNQKKILNVDEIQKVYGWSEAIKSLYDAAKRKKNF